MPNGKFQSVKMSCAQQLHTLHVRLNIMYIGRNPFFNGKIQDFCWLKFLRVFHGEFGVFITVNPQLLVSLHFKHFTALNFEFQIDKDLGFAKMYLSSK